MISLPILLGRLQFWSMEIIRLRRTQDGYSSGDRWRLMVAVDQFNQATVDARTAGIA